MCLNFHLEIALGSTMLLGCHGNLGALVEVCRISKPSQLPVASDLQLQPWFVYVCVCTMGEVCCMCVLVYVLYSVRYSVHV